MQQFAGFLFLVAIGIVNHGYYLHDHQQDEGIQPPPG